MSLFDRLVSEALKNCGELSLLRAVVEKELLHHDILREMSEAGLLKSLTFIGGTCLRMGYGSNRLSEDLDFSGGHDFKKATLLNLGDVLLERLEGKYGLKVEVSKPVREVGNVSTWKLKVMTHPLKKNMPLKRIHIDICSIPSYDSRPMVLRNHYGVEMGTSGLIIQAESLEEILADKIVALVLRPNRMKNRDLWDIGWLKQRNIEVPTELVRKKIADHRREVGEFLELMNERIRRLDVDAATRREFITEMKRFLPPEVIKRTVEKEEFWVYLKDVINMECNLVSQTLKGVLKQRGFEM